MAAGAYPLTLEVKAGRDRRSKLDPRAHIGYLVGYRGVAIYKIWIPELAEVIVTRDVTFNEGQFYDPSEKRPHAIVQQLEDLAAKQQVDVYGHTEQDEDIQSTIFVGGWEDNMADEAEESETADDADEADEDEINKEDSQPGGRARAQPASRARGGS